MTDPRFKPGCLTPEPIHFIGPFPQSIPKYRYAKIYFFYSSIDVQRNM